MKPFRAGVAALLPVWAITASTVGGCGPNAEENTAQTEASQGAGKDASTDALGTTTAPSPENEVNYNRDSGNGVSPPAKPSNGDGGDDERCDGASDACAPTKAVCGDGLAGFGEACDDGNTVGGDGCSADCKAVEAPYWACTFGAKCIDVRDCAALLDAGLGADAGCQAPPKASVCGDGILDPGEACDDKNTVGGDGCTADCKAVEANSVCPTPGQPCVSTQVCGDGLLTGTEQCDDANALGGDGCSGTCTLELGWACVTPGLPCSAKACGDGLMVDREQCDDLNTVSGDGCSATCELEPGYKCPPATSCSPTTCGDGLLEGLEQCDDGNLRPYDGCTASCTVEPICANGLCPGLCGDGIKFPSEACDDGNKLSGDGCSSTCTLEPGFVCTENVAAMPATLEVPIIYRDFTPATHPDFEHRCCGLAEKLVLPAAKTNAFGFPVPQFNPATGSSLMTSASAFDQWYADVPGVNKTILSSLTLKRLPNGSYEFDDTTFFPLDGLGYGNYAGYGHNFHFTSELRSWFTFQGGEVLKFRGDDDVWVFINGQLVVDLGGVHGAVEGSVTLDDAKANALGLVKGNLYDFAVFQAERHTVESNYQLTLGGFVKAKTSCAPQCGDGIRTRTEACDLGAANSSSASYGGCTTSCTRGAFCGDGQVDNAHEACDDGVNLTLWAPKASATACAPGCKKPAFCGDGIIQAAYGETCDEGPANANASDPTAYGKCLDTCQRGPRCGDGIVQAADGEACDNGFNIASYVANPLPTDCAPGCRLPRRCGDGIVETPLEVCDKGAANTDGGAYDSCTTSCTYGPRCGDGVLQREHGETCDDGNRLNGDGCSAACLSEAIVPK